MSFKIGHQVAPLALVASLATRWLGSTLLLALSVGIELVSSLARVTPVMSQTGLGVGDIRLKPKMGGSDKKGSYPFPFHPYHKFLHRTT